MKSEETPAAPLLLQSIENYYNQCWSDYHNFWHDSSSYALHFGCWQKGTSNHWESLRNTDRVVAAYAAIQPGDVVLDAGCGVGGTATWLAREYRAKVSGVNITRSHIRWAQRLLSLGGSNNPVTFSCQDHSRLAFRSGTFNVVYAIESMCYAPDKREFLKEAFRVLKPGGRLVLLDGFRTDRILSTGENALLTEWLRAWVIPNLEVASNISRLAETIGFSECRFFDITAQVRPSLRRLRQLANALYPFASILRVLGVRSDVQHENVRAARLQWDAVELGLWVYGVFYALKTTDNGYG